ncbi:hypothetical protein VTG60DRAFT_3430 [Thermothelomyces hinnuleus]
MCQSHLILHKCYHTTEEIVPCKKAQKSKKSSSGSPCTVVQEASVCKPTKDICKDCERSKRECHREWDKRWEKILKIAKEIKEVHAEMAALKKTYEKALGIFLDAWFNDYDVGRDTYWDLYRQQMDEYYERGKKKLSDWYNVYDPNAYAAIEGGSSRGGSSSKHKK